MFSTPVVSQEIEWHTFNENKIDSRPTYVNVHVKWCFWCKKMDNTLNSKPIIELMNEHFYAIDFNSEYKNPINFKGKKYVNLIPNGHRSTHGLTEKLLKGKITYPSSVFLDKNNEIILIVNGYLEPIDLKYLLIYIGESIYKTKSWKEYESSLILETDSVN